MINVDNDEMNYQSLHLNTDEPLHDWRKLE